MIEKKFFRDVYAKALASPPVKCLILVSFALYLAGAIYGCSQLREGLDRARLTLDVSYAKDFFNADDKYFKSFPYRVQVGATVLPSSRTGACRARVARNKL